MYTVLGKRTLWEHQAGHTQECKVEGCGEASVSMLTL